MLRYLVLAAISVMASTLPTHAQQRATAGALFKQGYTMVLHGGTTLFVMQKGNSAYACQWNGKGGGADDLAVYIRTADCAEI